MRVLALASSDINGGAARAANRLHRSLLSHGMQSAMYVSSKQSDDWRVKGPEGNLAKALGKIRPRLDRLPITFQRTRNPVLHSAAWLSGLHASQINASDADIVNLHWICDGCLSVEEIARIKKPLVWTLHDMWAFCGAEHYAPEGSDVRWRLGYAKTNRDPGSSGLDIDRWVWRRKQRSWKHPFHIITPSRWLAECVSQSALMRDSSISIVPNVLDTGTFRPIPKKVARDVLGLPGEANLLLFGAVGGGRDHRKGWDLLQPALTHLAGRGHAVQCLIFGEGEPRYPPNLGLPLRWMGHLHDDSTLALLYSAADVMVVPSRQEAFGQTGSEAQACGCPVVAFNATGLRDVVEHAETGYLAEPYSSDDLAVGIEWVLADRGRQTRLSAQARQRAIRLWAPEVVVPQHLEVYRKAVAEQSTRKARVGVSAVVMR